MPTSVHTERHGAITVVTLNRPEVRNAVDADTARALHTAFLAFEADDSSPVAVFHGAHGHFCAGWDLQAGARLDPDDPQALAHLEWPEHGTQPLGPMGPSRLLLRKPVVAAISGAAVAGGMELALWCDLRVMEEDAYFGIYCRRFGVPLIDGGTVRLPRLIGLGHAMDLILTGRRVDAPEARALGLANRVVPAGQALQGALELARSLAAFPQDTLNADRLSAYQQAGLPLQQALQQEWAQGRACLGQALAGARHFSSGQGRHGADVGGGTAAP
ncbi:MAG: crotonase/enoyl-CoA hydratase family protein [Rhodoferax sp.]